MAITVGVDTYVTIIDADAYFAAGYGFGSWDALDETTKEQALVSAAKQLDVQCTWFGSMCASDQAMAFPRSPDCPDIPQDISDAQCEIAYRIVDTGSTQTDGGDPLTELTAGSVTLKFKASSTSNPLINDYTSDLLSQYGLCSGSGSTTIIPAARS